MKTDLMLLQDIINISKQAGEAILSIYARDFKVESKQDKSPITEADLASHNVIMAGLAKLTPHIPVLSEESADLIKSGEWRAWNTYWLIDPLDGTKEFVKRNGEFTVNIALIHNHKPVLGVIHIPVSNTSYAGAVNLGAFKLSDGEVILDKTQTIKVNKSPKAPYRIAGSRSHLNNELNEHLKNFNDIEIVTIGSSLKICLVAEGAIDFYPRLGHTFEWDTAAGQAIVEAAGGELNNLDGKPFLYNTKKELLNPYFIVHGKNDIDWFKFLPESI